MVVPKVKAIEDQIPYMEEVWVDNDYIETGHNWIKEHMGWEVEMVSHLCRPREM